MNKICALIVGSLWGASTLLSFAAPLASSPNRSEWDKWSVQLGVAVITANVVDDFIFGDFDRAKGDPGGEIYLLSLSRDMHEFEWQVRDTTVRPVLGLKGTLGIIDEGGRSPFMDYSLGVVLRWTDFPWNEWVYTNLESGVGLSYTEKILAIERQRHPGRDRSHVGFYWPIELTLAHPRYRQHQAVFFLHHRSGGRIFHRGGSNSVGIGYRYAFGHR